MLLEEKILNGNCLYTPGGAAREYAAVGCNFYRGCPYQCQYCYNRKGRTAKVMGVDHAVLENKFTNTKYRPKKYAGLSGEDYAYQLFVSEVEKNLEYLCQTGIFYSFSTDPMCPDTYKLTVKTATFAVHQGIPVRILTKNARQDVWDDILRMIDELEAEEKKLFAFGFTLTGCDDWEPYASPNSQRIERMKWLHNKGFYTFISIEPVIDFKKSYQMIIDTLDFCDFYMIGLLSHYASYYTDDNGRTYEGILFLRKLFMLQQILGLKIYYKESIRKKFDTTLFGLYNDRFKHTVKPVKTIYHPFTVLSYGYQLLNAIYYINKNIALLYRYTYLRPEEELFDVFCLRLFFERCVNKNLLKEFLFENKESYRFNYLKDLLSEFVLLRNNLGNFKDTTLSFDQSFIEKDLKNMLETCNQIISITLE